jgi:hypothetical protein
MVLMMVLEEKESSNTVCIDHEHDLFTFLFEKNKLILSVANLLDTYNFF